MNIIYEKKDILMNKNKSKVMESEVCHDNNR